MIVVELFQGRINFGEFWGSDWSLNEHVKSPESRWEHDFRESSKILIAVCCDWILTLLVNAP